MLGVAAVDGDGVVVVEPGDGPATDSIAELLVEKARPQIGRVVHVGVGIEDLETVAHVVLPGSAPFKQTRPSVR